MEGWVNAVSYASVGWLILMGALYILGALLYAGRIPERYFPGKCDIWVWRFFIYIFIFLRIINSIIQLSLSIFLPTTVPKSSDIPRSGDCCRVCSLPRNIRNGRLSTDEQSMPRSRIGSNSVLNHTPTSTTTIDATTRYTIHRKKTTHHPQSLPIEKLFCLCLMDFFPRLFF